MLYCGAAFGGSFLFMRLAAPDMPPAVVAFLRVGIAALILLAVGGPRVARARRLASFRVLGGS
jgi:threonine/homoserine efflux transporter RhtA